MRDLMTPLTDVCNRSHAKSRGFASREFQKSDSSVRRLAVNFPLAASVTDSI
jgi:hypothetical protein